MNPKRQNAIQAAIVLALLAIDAFFWLTRPPELGSPPVQMTTALRLRFFAVVMGGPGALLSPVISSQVLMTASLVVFAVAPLLAAVAAARNTIRHPALAWGFFGIALPLWYFAGFTVAAIALFW
jgi:hypothetical protein